MSEVVGERCHLCRWRSRNVRAAGSATCWNVLSANPREAAGGPPEAYAQVLERALAACEADPAAECLDVLELHDELAEAYDPTGSGGACAAAGGRPG